MSKTPRLASITDLLKAPQNSFDTTLPPDEQSPDKGETIQQQPPRNKTNSSTTNLVAQTELPSNNNNTAAELFERILEYHYNKGAVFAPVTIRSDYKEQLTQLAQISGISTQMLLNNILSQILDVNGCVSISDEIANYALQKSMANIKIFPKCQ